MKMKEREADINIIIKQEEKIQTVKKIVHYIYIFNYDLLHHCFIST